MLDGYLVVKDEDIITGENLNKQRIDFVPVDESDPEIFRIRGYKPKKSG
jgi:hypothetical protein